MYFGYGYWDGDCILYTKQVVDGGLGLLSNLVCVVGDCRLYWWWPLAVAGVFREFHAFS